MYLLKLFYLRRHECYVFVGMALISIYISYIISLHAYQITTYAALKILTIAFNVCIVWIHIFFLWPTYWFWSDVRINFCSKKKKVSFKKLECLGLKNNFIRFKGCKSWLDLKAGWIKILTIKKCTRYATVLFLRRHTPLSMQLLEPFYKGVEDTFRIFCSWLVAVKFLSFI